MSTSVRLAKGGLDHEGRYYPRRGLSTGIGALAVCIALQVSGAAGAEAPLAVKEPAKVESLQPRVPERGKWTWDQPKAEVTPTGDLKWSPAPFVFAVGTAPRYIDFEQGDDARDGTSRDTAWKHHPWDPNAAGAAKACKGVHTYIFKRGVTYRGALCAVESGEAGNPIRLTSDPAWGSGEAVICGSQRVTGWTRGATNTEIPDGDKVWYADVDFLPRNVWEIRDGTVIRIPLARTPNWKVSDPEDVLSEWWTWEQPQWWTGKWQIKTPKGRRHLGIDPKHLTQDASYYVGATLRTEYGIVMGTPFPTRVEAFDAKQKGLVFEGIFFGDSEKILPNNRYYLEDKPQYLDVPGEFWVERNGNGGPGAPKGQGGRLFLRLPDDRDPNTSVVEAGREINLIQDLAAEKEPERIDYLKPEQLDKLVATGVSNLQISGLTFRFANTHWDLTLPGWGHKDVLGACIRLLGSSAGIRIDHCKFEHVNRAIRIEPIYSRCRVQDVVVADNEIEDLDHGAMSIGEGRPKGADDSVRRLVDVKVLRNRVFMTGMRQPRQDADFSIYVDNAVTAEIAGNISQRTYGSGIFVMRGKDLGGSNLRDVPLARTLIYENRVVESLLTANDWGGIEANGGGAAYVFNNISGNANGYWNWAYKKDKPGSARLGMAYYLDGGGSKTYLFNNVAWGLTRDPTSRLCNQCAFYEAGANIFNTFFNNTADKFYMGSNWSPAGGRYMSLGNVWAEFGGWVFMHGKLKEDKGPLPADYPLFSDAYGRNVFCDVSPEFAIIDAAGRKLDGVQAMDQVLATNKSLCLDAGIQVQGSPFRNAAEHDFRPAAGAPVVDRGVKVFVPWALSRTVGEWNFRRNNADPTVLLDDHFYPAAYCVDRVDYTRRLLFPLKAANATAADYVAGPLEDWTEGALVFNGKDRYASLSQAEMTQPYTCEVSQGKLKQKRTFSGKELATPDIDTGNLLIELYFRTEPGHAGSVVVAKMADAGYQLAVNKAGGLTLTLKAGGQAAELAVGARINDGKWHHALAEVDRAAKRAVIYVDGVKAGEDTVGLDAAASLSNDGDLLVGKGPDGHFFAGAIDFLRIARGTLADAKTTLEELYDWEFAGPFLRDFAGRAPVGKGRDAGAFEAVAEP